MHGPRRRVPHPRIAPAELVKLYGLSPAFDVAYGDEKAKLVSREALTAAKCSPDG